MYTDYKTFGQFVRGKRLDAGDVTLKDIGRMLSISLSYYSDIEHDRRNPGDGFDYEALADLLRLSEEEKAYMYDLAGKCRKTVPEDIEDVMEGIHPSAREKEAGRTKGVISDDRVQLQQNK